MAAPDSSAERRALGWSIFAATVLGAGGVIAGIITGSQIILLDGAYAFIGVVVSWLLLLASRVVGSGPTGHYPFGREALTPLVVGIQGFVLLAIVAYAVVDAIGVIIDGGSDVAAGWALAYAVFTTAVSIIVWRYLHRSAKHSDLVSAEASAWKVSAILGLGMMIGFTLIAGLDRADITTVAPYIDPAMVLATSAVLLPSPLRLVRSTYVELLEGVPSPTVQASVKAEIASLCDEYDLAAPVVRMTKIGPKLYVEVDGTAHPDLSIAHEDEVRRSLEARLDVLPFDVWLNLELTPER